MNTYKIKNTTKNLAKRDQQFNSEVRIEYVDEMEKKVMFLKPDQTLFFTAASLPLSVRRLNVKGLISVSEIGPKELKKAIADSKNKTQKPQVSVKKENKAVETTTTTKKKRTYTKKSTSSKSKSTTSKSKSTYDIVSDTQKENDEE